MPAVGIIGNLNIRVLTQLRLELFRVQPLLYNLYLLQCRRDHNIVCYLYIFFVRARMFNQPTWFFDTWYCCSFFYLQHCKLFAVAVYTSACTAAD